MLERWIITSGVAFSSFLYFVFIIIMYIHSFIHTEHLYSASSRELLRGAPDSSTAKKSSLKLRKNAGDKVHNMTIQLRINNIYMYNNNYASAICHNILHCGEWQKHYLDIL